ncbi:MAG: hypothetical protein H8F28_02585 [Fibrella sp.]|nr:hypothetical protein [Armatimonadota bacterium]
MTEIVEDVAADDAGIAVHLTNGDGFTWGETIEGIVTISPHPTESVTFSVISVSVAEQDTEGFMTPVGFAGTRDPLNPIGATVLGTEFSGLGNPPVQTSYEEIVIARDVTMAPRTPAQEIPFTISVSKNIRLTTLCFVAARAVATDGVDNDRHAAVSFVLLPPHAIQGIQNTLKTFGDFEEVEVSNASAEAGKVRYTLDYIAPKNLQDRLDGIKFELVETDTQITGFAEINPQEKTLADHLRSFVHADRIRFPLEFDRAELAAAGTAKTTAVSVKQRLHELLDTFLNPVTM